MVFSSAIFLFLFLPVVLLLHSLAGQRFRNGLLLCASLVFYAWGEGAYVLVMLASLILNTLFGRLLDTLPETNRRKWILGVMLGLNLLPLLYFKYSIFLANSLNTLLETTGWQLHVPASLHLPIGISFFTFQAISYLIDVYRHTSRSRRSVIDVGLYISLFPQLIAGPIVRYHDISEQILQRIQSRPLFASGVQRFIFGLGKKMLIANPLGLVADTIFALPADTLSFSTAWLGIGCYALQIYFDFSGYSDMAIGLGRMFGFRFLENFNFPYISRSIREFWRRWHISLSNWFRDYLYIPLGGNRGSPARTACNLFLVFLICGLWHGASWNFILWGLLHGGLLIMERGRLGKLLNNSPVILQHSYVLLAVLTAWVFFRADTLSASMAYLSVMYSWPQTLELNKAVTLYLDREFYLALGAGILLSTPLYPQLVIRYQKMTASLPPLYTTGYLLRLVLLLFIFWLCLMQIAIGSYNPFIYFRF